jgi:hypothetical protein
MGSNREGQTRPDDVGANQAAPTPPAVLRGMSTHTQHTTHTRTHKHTQMEDKEKKRSITAQNADIEIRGRQTERQLTRKKEEK